MSEPIVLYPKAGGEFYVCASTAYANQLLATGDWSLDASELQVVKQAEPERKKATGDGAPMDEWGGLATALVGTLIRAGYTTPAAVRDAPDDEILAIKSLGEKALLRIREALG